MRNGQVFELRMPEHRTTDSEFSSLPTPATSEPGFTVSPVDKDGQPTNNPNERWYHPETGRLLQKGISQVLKENDLLGTVTTATSGRSPEFRKGSNPNPVEFVEDLQRSLMPTPKARDSQPEGYEAGLRRATPQVGTIVKGLVDGDPRVLIPTPTTRDHKDGSEPHERDGVVQTDTVARAVFNSGEIVLPTPTTNGNDRKGPNYSSAGILQELEIANGILPKEYKDWEHAKEKVKWAEPLEGQTKTNLDSETNWGKFEPAIKRWEATLGRPAPAPTKPDGKEGGHRLSSAFTEWMMGVPEGWITDCGLSRNDELKACGNGVVPQQAELALRVLLEGITLPAGGGQVNLPTPTVSDTFTDNLKSSQQKEGSMHSVTLPQAVKWVAGD
jgi:hypothetical protein